MAIDVSEFNRGYQEGYCAILGNNQAPRMKVIPPRIRTLNKTDYQVGLLQGVSDALGVEDIEDFVHSHL